MRVTTRRGLDVLMTGPAPTGGAPASPGQTSSCLQHHFHHGGSMSFDEKGGAQVSHGREADREATQSARSRRGRRTGAAGGPCGRPEGSGGRRRRSVQAPSEARHRRGPRQGQYVRGGRLPEEGLRTGCGPLDGCGQVARPGGDATGCLRPHLQPPGPINAETTRQNGETFTARERQLQALADEWAKVNPGGGSNRHVLTSDINGAAFDGNQKAQGLAGAQ